MTIKSLVSYNVNGIRAAIKKGLVDWMKDGNFDVVCIQETKAQKEQVPVQLFHDLGYEDYWFSAQKKGYSGVAIFTKIKPDQVVYGCGIETYDYEGRVIRADFGDVTLLNCYFPSGTSGGARQEVKMKFLADFFNYIAELKKTRPKIIVVGDYNIAHTENDIHNPKGNKKTTGFLPEEREWMTQWFDSGFVDAFRYLNPEQTQYSWWSYRANARNNNKGWRIDYASFTKNMSENLKSCQQLNDVKHSDHCPVWVELN